MNAIGWPELLCIIAVGILLVALFFLAKFFISRRTKQKPRQPEKVPPLDLGDRTQIKDQYSAQNIKEPEPSIALPETEPKSYQQENIFISYRREDSADIVGRIYDRLVEHFIQSAVFKDVDSIPLGVDYRKYLDTTVGQSKILLAIIGQQWISAVDSEGTRRLDNPADFVRIEVQSALDKGIPVIPVLVQQAKMPTEAELPEVLKALAYHNGISVRPDPDFHRDMDRLIDGIEKHL